MSQNELVPKADTDLAATAAEADTASPAAAAAAAAHMAKLELADLRARVHCFTETAPDAVIHFQVIDMGMQLYVWIGVGGAKFQNLYLAIQSPSSPIPAVATLLPDASSSSASSLAQRLARRVGRPVVCSCNLPHNADMLQVIAERRLFQELKQLGLAGSKPAAGAAAAAGGGGGGAAAAAGATAGQEEKEQQQQKQKQLAAEGQESTIHKVEHELTQLAALVADCAVLEN